ncbi:MAG: hypothetical protein NWE83_13555 [Candidatus Bathyarchaeota archaeon]|nr:hypothetical protein [Candidatus Bathyarchaeota archaeon]
MIKESLLLVIRRIEEEIEDRWGRNALFRGSVADKLSKTETDYRRLQRMLDYYFSMLYRENWLKTREFRQILRKNGFHDAFHCLKYYGWDIEDGIFPLILELNRIGVETLESCEGHFGDTWSNFHAPSIQPWVCIKQTGDVTNLKALFASFTKDHTVRFTGSRMILNVMGNTERHALITQLTTQLQQTG